MSVPSDKRTRTVLFLCTGNYYRSRFAEILFNSLCERGNLAWRADSRGLALEMGYGNVGPMSSHALRRLETLGISTTGYMRLPAGAKDADFATADLIVAVKHAEHHPLMQERFPHWAGRVEYWHVHDLDFARPEEALPQLQKHVEELVNRLAADGPRCSA